MSLRILVAGEALALICTAPAMAKPVDGPELPTRFFNAVPDVCFSIARGHPPMSGSGSATILEPAPDIPPTVRAHYPQIPTWHRLKSQPANIFIGTGDKPGACHLILANTTQTATVQNVVMGFMSLWGSRVISATPSGAAMTDMLYAKEGPDGYMLVSLQGPRDAVRGGDGDQSAVHVRLMPKADFEALLPLAMRPKPPPANPHPPIPHMRMVFRDYPSAALRNGWEGTVSYRASIDATGAVLDCQITESSGYPPLDRSTCQYVKRWHFLPATDAKGNNISGTWASRETYTAPK